MYYTYIAKTDSLYRYWHTMKNNLIMLLRIVQDYSTDIFAIVLGLSVSTVYCNICKTDIKRNKRTASFKELKYGNSNIRKYSKRYITLTLLQLTKQNAHSFVPQESQEVLLCHRLQKLIYYLGGIGGIQSEYRGFQVISYSSLHQVELFCQQGSCRIPECHLQ